MYSDAGRGRGSGNRTQGVGARFNAAKARNLDAGKLLVEASELIGPAGFSTTDAGASCFDTPTRSVVVLDLRASRVGHGPFAPYLIKAVVHGLFLGSELLYEPAGVEMGPTFAIVM